MSVDYKELLKKYMQHVAECEGITFVSNLNDCMNEVTFTHEEVQELQQIHNSITE